MSKVPEKKPKSSRAEARKQRFKEAEASKSAEERFMNRDDFEDHINKTMSAARLTSIEQMKTWFVEFASHDDIQLCTELDAVQFFEKSGKVITLKIARQFFEYLATSRVGIIVSPITGQKHLHVNTLLGYLYLLVSAAKRCQNPIDRDVVDRTHDWIRYKLDEKKLINRHSEFKHVSMPGDVTTLLHTIFSVKYMATLRNTREVLNLSLVVNMLVDCAGRVGELVRGKNKKFLKWKRVSFYAFQDDIMSPVKLRAKILYADIKDGENDPNRTKSIPFRLLPLELAAEDTLRQLLTVALIDGVFENISTWEDFQALRPGPDGRRILTKEEFNERPASPYFNHRFRRRLNRDCRFVAF
jgi:hypothetical protein